jgi:cell division protein FtsI/penicillin-binding protein 2
MERWSTTDIIRESSNVGTIMIAEHLGKERLDAALHAFGLGTRTAVEFPGQAEGILLEPERYYATGLASVPIGYGVAVSAQQMVDVYATIANGGTSRPPRLVAATLDADGNEHPTRVVPGTRVVSEDTARTVGDMLTEVVRGGTGACAAIPGYTVAGKTGTSRKADGHGGYSTNKHYASFIGFAPAEAPRVATIVVLDEPDQNGYGGRVAAPVFAEITGAALQLLRVAPPDAGSTQFNEAQAHAGADGVDCTVPHGEELDQWLDLKAQWAREAAKAQKRDAASKPQAAATTADSRAQAGTLPATSANQ